VILSGIIGIEEQLSRRLLTGPLSREANRRIEEASHDQLILWAKRVLTAANLRAVFAIEIYREASTFGWAR
jgi:hypothetical protein